MSKSGDSRSRGATGRGDQGSENGIDRGATPSAMPADDSYLNTDGRASESSGATTTSPPETSEGVELPESESPGPPAQAQADGTPSAPGDAARPDTATATDEQREKYLRL